MGYVDRFIKKISLENTKYKEKKTLLPNLRPGDIIWAKRYSKEEVRENIDLEHQESPFIVIYKNELNISYCLECSSKEETKQPNIIKFEKKDYPHILYKDTYVKLKSDIELTSYRYIRKMGSLTVSDFNILKKNLFLLMTDEENAKLFSFTKSKLNFYLDSGDFIRKDGDHYLVGYKEGNTLYSYRAIKDEFNSDITINSIPFKIRYDKKIKISATDTYMLLGIYHKYKSYFKKQKFIGYHLADIGDLIQVNNNYYLVYGKYKEYLVVIRVYKDIKGLTIKTYDISINNTNYKTGYNFFLLSSEYEYNIISNILEFEICEYTNRLKDLNITPNLNTENIIETNNLSNTTLSTLQKEILNQLKEMNFSFEEITRTMIELKGIKEQLKFREYLIKNYDEKDKEIVKNAASYIVSDGIFNNKLFLKEGDIILAKRTNDSNIKNNIIKDYKSIGPYVIIYVDREKEKIYALSGAYSVIRGPKTFFKIKSSSTELQEDTIHLKSIIPTEITKDDYIKKIDELPNEELNTLRKKVYAIMYYNEDNNFFNKEVLSYYNSPFDIINYKNNYYLIFDEDNKYFYSYQLYESIYPYLKINDIGYMVNLRNITKIPKDKTYEVVYIIKPKLLDVIKNKKRWKDIKLPIVEKNIETATQGDIINYNNIYYLVFGEYKNYLQLYKLYTKQENNFACSFIADSKTFYTNFQIYLISKNANITITDNVNQDKLNEINNIRKSYKKVNTIYNTPLDYKDEQSPKLNKEQLQLIDKLKEYDFSEEEIIGYLVALNNKFVIDEILDFIIKKEQTNTISKSKIGRRIRRTARKQE